MKNKTMDTIKASNLALMVTDAPMQVTNVTCKQVERDGKDVHDFIIEGVVNDTPMTVTLPGATIAALAAFGTSVRIEKGAKMAAFQTGVVLAAGAEAGKQAINHFLYGKGRGKHGPRGVPVEPEGAAQSAPEVQEMAAENAPMVNEEAPKPTDEQPLDKAA